MDPQLTASHRGTYDAIFKRPSAHNLQWRDVWSLLGAVADATSNADGSLKVARNGLTLILHRPRGKDMADAKEMAQIRHFLERSGAPAPQAAAAGGHLLVVIDHREARVYRTELHGSVPQRITPYDPHGTGRHLHVVEDDANGQRKPERKSYYDAVARTLSGAESVLLFGSGTGASSAMEQLLADLKEHHADVSGRIAGSVVVNAKHLTEDQLLAKAREFYATRQV